MAERIQLEIVTPKGAIVSDEVDIVTAPGYAGEFGVLANHAPLLSTIKIGTLIYKKDGKEFTLMVSGGFCDNIVCPKGKLRYEFVSVRRSRYMAEGDSYWSRFIGHCGSHGAATQIQIRQTIT